jgi:hypothetical protein
LPISDFRFESFELQGKIGNRKLAIGNNRHSSVGDSLIEGRPLFNEGLLELWDLLKVGDKVTQVAGKLRVNKYPQFNAAPWSAVTPAPLCYSDTF